MHLKINILLWVFHHEYLIRMITIKQNITLDY